MTDPLSDLATRSEAEAYEGFVCWKPELVAQVINPEAAAPSREVLLATHHSVPIQRLNVSDAGVLGDQGVVSEDSVRDVVAARRDDALIVPIIGPSGSGKSHFVLWLRAAIERDPVSSRRVVYVDKGQVSLAGVIEQILMGETGPEFDELRSSVREASSGMDERQAALRFRNAVAEAVDELAQGRQVGISEHREYALTHLPALLFDDAYAVHLLGENGPFRRAVKAALGQKNAGDDLPEARFDQNDLPRTLGGDEENLGARARTFLGHLGDPGVATASIDLLNEVRDAAMSRVFGVEPNELVRVMRRLRERLFDRDPETEIILMIEDFTLLQGVQYELLEAMLELPIREGKKGMCDLRAVIAVTRERFTEILAHSDTLRTRLASQGHVYSIDLRYAEDQDKALDKDALALFVARYLNAVRVGSDAIESTAPEVPNACTNCAHQIKCHEAFGQAAEGAQGYGLYPFNAEVLAHLAVARREEINPRALLDTLRTTLVDEASALRGGRFPTDDWGNGLLPADPALRDKILLPFEVRDELGRTQEGDRRIWLQTFWSDERDRIADLDPGVHQAFRLPPLGKKPTPPRPPPQGPSTPKAPGPRLDPLQRWVNGGELSAGVARELRKRLRQAIIERAGGVTLLVDPEYLENVFPAESISIEGAEGGGRLGRDAIKFDFPRAPETAVFFQQAQIAATVGWDDLDSPRRLVEYVRYLDGRADSLRRLLDERRDVWAEELGTVVQLLAISGLMLGLAPDPRMQGLLAGVTHSGEDPDANSSSWFGQARCSRAASARKPTRRHAMRFVYAARAIEKSDQVAVDAAAITPHLEQLIQTWEIPDAQSTPEIAKPLAKALMQVAPQLEAAHIHLAEWQEEINQTLGSAPKVTGLVARLDKVGARARRHGVADGSLSLDLSSEEDFSTLNARVGSLLSQWEGLSMGERIFGVLSIDREVLDRFGEEVGNLSRDLDKTLALAEERRQKSQGANADKLTEALVGKIENLRQDLERLRGGTS